MKQTQHRRDPAIHSLVHQQKGKEGSGSSHMNGLPGCLQHAQLGIHDT